MGKKRKHQEESCDREEKSHHVTESIEEPTENLSNQVTYLKKKKKNKKGEKEIIPDCSDSQIASNEPEETSKSETKRKKKTKSASEGETCDENETLVMDQETKKKKKKKKGKSEAIETDSLGKSEKVLQDDSTINESLITNDSECIHSHSEAKIKKKKKKSKDKIKEFEICDSSQNIAAESMNEESGRSVKSESDEQTKKKKKKRKCEVEATSSESVTGEHDSCDKLATEFNSRKDKKKKKKKKNKQETDVNESEVERVESAAKCETGNSKKNKKKNKLREDMDVKNEDEISCDKESSNPKKKKAKKRKKSEDDTDQEVATKLDDEDKTVAPKKKKKHKNDAGESLNSDHSTKAEQTKAVRGKPDSAHPDKNDSTDKTTQSAGIANGTKNSSSCGQWGTANLGSSERNNKFLRLMGGFKKASGDSGSEKVPETKMKFNQALSADLEKNLYNQLESQFERARNFSLARKNNMGGGLGYEPPPGANKKFHIDTNKTNSVKFSD